MIPRDNCGARKFRCVNKGGNYETPETFYHQFQVKLKLFPFPRPPVYERHKCRRRRLLHNSIKRRFNFTFRAFFRLHAISNRKYFLLLQFFSWNNIFVLFANRWTLFYCARWNYAKKISRALSLLLLLFHYYFWWTRNWAPARNNGNKLWFIIVGNEPFACWLGAQFGVHDIAVPPIRRRNEKLFAFNCFAVVTCRAAFLSFALETLFFNRKSMNFPLTELNINEAFIFQWILSLPLTLLCLQFTRAALEVL